MDTKEKTRIFENVDRSRVGVILKGLADNGSMVSGNNPWDVDTRKHGVCLRGEWNEETAKLAITITAADWYVPHGKIWESIYSLIKMA
jgi:hypothetical protein